MDKNIKNKLNQLFNQFAQEEKDVSSFALGNLLNRTIRIVEENAEDGKDEKPANKNLHQED